MVQGTHSQTPADAGARTARRPLRVLLAGASGFVGSHLRPHLERAGHGVAQLVRRRANSQSGEIEWDPGSGRFDARQMAGFDAVINLAGENIASGRWSSSLKQRIRDSRVETTRLLAEAMASGAPGPSVFVAASAIGYYGSREQEVLTEAAGPGQGFLADVGREWEAACEPARRAGIRVVNLRIGVVLSPKGGAMAKMLPVFRMGMGGVVASGNQWVAWIALTDLLRVFEFVLNDDTLTGPVNAVAPKPVTNRELTKTIGGLVNRPTVLPLPAAAVRLTMGEMGVETLLASTRVVPERLETAGFRFEYPDLEQALRHEMG